MSRLQLPLKLTNRHLEISRQFWKKKVDDFFFLYADFFMISNFVNFSRKIICYNHKQFIALAILGILNAYRTDLGLPYAVAVLRIFSGWGGGFL